MPITQVMQVQFKELVSPEEMQEVCDGALALKDSCLHPTTKKPLVKSVIGGVDSSPEGLQQGGMTHVFIVEFEDEENHRVYRSEENLPQKEFAETLSKLAANYTILDFTPGVFERRRSSAFSGQRM